MKDALADALFGPAYETLCQVEVAWSRLREWKAAHALLIAERESLLDRSMKVANELSYHILWMDTPDEEILRMRAEYGAVHVRLHEVAAVLDPSFTEWMAGYDPD
jgi:hypothetical protein